MATVTFKHITKRFGMGKPAVDDLNLEIRDKEFLVLVGPSGCGKTTTLRMLAGLETPSEGEIYIDREEITNIAPKNRDIAMVFQSYALYPHMNVQDNLAFGLKNRNLTSTEKLTVQITSVISYTVLLLLFYGFSLILDMIFAGASGLFFGSALLSLIIGFILYPDLRKLITHAGIVVTKSMLKPLQSYLEKMDEINEKVRDTAIRLEIEDLLDRKPKQLSGGQRQRVAVGRAIIRDPKVFLMDEPLSNLDAKLRNSTRVELADLQRKLQTSTLYVTHDQVEAMTLGHRIAVMNQGIIEHVGTPNEIYREPRTTFVAGFIGTPPMNLIHGTLESTKSGYHVTTEVVEFPLPEGIPQQEILAKWEGKQIILGIRPEHITVLHDATANSIAGIVTFTEAIGSTTNVHVKIADQNLKIVETGYKSYPVLTNLNFEFTAQYVHLYDPETTVRIELLESAEKANI